MASARASIAELELRADIDPLLDIFNRRGLEPELQRSLSYIERYCTDAALIYVDFDGFKAVNDAHGTMPATRCSRRWRASLPPMSAPPTCRPASAATNSAC